MQLNKELTKKWEKGLRFVCYISQIKSFVKIEGSWPLCSETRGLACESCGLRWTRKLNTD